MEAQQMLEMKMGQLIKINEDTAVIRIMGGWIVETRFAETGNVSTQTFVPVVHIKHDPLITPQQDVREYYQKIAEQFSDLLKAVLLIDNGEIKSPQLAKVKHDIREALGYA